MKVFLTSAYPIDPITNFTPNFLKESYQADPYKIHEITDDPNEADIIIFAEHHPGPDPFFFDVLKNKIYKKFKHKCYLYHDADYSLTFIPTISPSILKSKSDPVFHRPYSYLVQLSPNSAIRETLPSSDKKFLFSFIGAKRNQLSRNKIFELKYDRSYVFDTANKKSWELSAAERTEYEQIYANVCYESKFILCPGGLGPNSYRLYESLEMGIAPVIISDEWVPSEGPEWDNFSVRIAESEVYKIPAILEEKEAEYSKMGQLARQAWLDWFAKDKQFHHLTETCISLHHSRPRVTLITYIKQFRRFLEPFYGRAILRFYKNLIKNNLFRLNK